MSHFRLIGSLVLAWMILLASQPSLQAQLTFNTSSSSNAEADTAFQVATNAWSVEFNDAITINLNISFSNLGAVSLANTASANQSNTFSEFTNAINADTKSADDETFVAGLPVGSSFSLYINRTTEAGGVENETPYVDADGGLNNTTVRLTTGNAKALGLRGANDSTLDGAIVFNDSFSWDFDQSDGIDPGSIDFIGVAMHEIGHVLGFESGVDFLDANGDGLSDDDEFDVVGSIDFLRFSADSEGAGADIDWTADARAKYLSIDGGATSLPGGSNHWATGFEFGDGDQASHWKDGAGLGLMNPTTGAGSLAGFSSIDLRVFDVVGYDRVVAIPEPAAGFLAGLFLLAVATRRRRRQ